MVLLVAAATAVCEWMVGVVVADGAVVEAVVFVVMRIGPVSE